MVTDDHVDFVALERILYPFPSRLLLDDVGEPCSVVAEQMRCYSLTIDLNVAVVFLCALQR